MGFYSMLGGTPINSSSAHSTAYNDGSLMLAQMTLRTLEWSGRKTPGEMPHWLKWLYAAMLRCITARGKRIEEFLRCGQFFERTGHNYQAVNNGPSLNLRDNVWFKVHCLFIKRWVENSSFLDITGFILFWEMCCRWLSDMENGRYVKRK